MVTNYNVFVADFDGNFANIFLAKSKAKIGEDISGHYKFTKGYKPIPSYPRKLPRVTSMVENNDSSFIACGERDNFAYVYVF
jgi:hypothetical protein